MKRQPINVELLERIGVIVIWIGVICITVSLIVVEKPAKQIPCPCSRGREFNLKCCQDCQCCQP